MSKNLSSQNAIVFIAFYIIVISSAKAQDNNDDEKKNSYFEPRISIQQKLSNNFYLDESNRNAYSTEITPGFTWIGNTSKIKGFADYSLNALKDSRKNQNQRFINNFNGYAKVEAIENIGYVDFYGSASTQPISVFENPADIGRFSSNSANVKTYKVSPFLKGILANDIDYELRYSLLNASSNSGIYSKYSSRDALAVLEKKPENRAIGWQALISDQTEVQESSRTVRTSIIKGGLSYSLSNQISFLTVAGMEATDQLSFKRENHSITGIGGKWKPSNQTFFSANFERHYYGGSHEILFEHRTARTIWSYKDSKGISSGFGSSSAASGTIFDLLSGFYAQIESDPVRRTQMVLTEIERLGLSNNTNIFQDYLRSTRTLQRQQTVSLAILGIRSTVAVQAFQANNKKAGGFLNPVDDFNLNNSISQYGWNLIASHRLTARSTIFFNLNNNKNKGTELGLKTDNKVILLGLNTRLSRKTNAIFQVQRSLFNTNTGSFGESQVAGTLTYRF